MEGSHEGMAVTQLVFIPSDTSNKPINFWAGRNFGSFRRLCVYQREECVKRPFLNSLNVFLGCGSCPFGVFVPAVSEGPSASPVPRTRCVVFQSCQPLILLFFFFFLINANLIFQRLHLDLIHAAVYYPSYPLLYLFHLYSKASL